MQWFIKIDFGILEEVEFSTLGFKVLGVFGWLLMKMNNSRRSFSCTMKELNCIAEFGDIELLNILVTSAAWKFGIEWSEIKPYKQTYRFSCKCPDRYECIDCSRFDQMSAEEIGKRILDRSLILDKEQLMWYDESLLNGKPESFKKWVNNLTLDKLCSAKQDVILATLHKGIKF